MKGITILKLDVFTRTSLSNFAARCIQTRRNLVELVPLVWIAVCYDQFLEIWRRILYTMQARFDHVLGW